MLEMYAVMHLMVETELKSNENIIMVGCFVTFTDVLSSAWTLTSQLLYIYNFLIRDYWKW